MYRIYLTYTSGRHRVIDATRGQTETLEMSAGQDRRFIALGIGDAQIVVNLDCIEEYTVKVINHEE